MVKLLAGLSGTGKTRRMIDEINQAVEDMHAGRNIRGVVVHEH